MINGTAIWRFFQKLDHFDQAGHWPDAMFVSGEMVCKKCTRGRTQRVLRLLEYRSVTAGGR